MLLARELLEEHPEVPVRDSVHAATMQNAGLSAIVSVDTHFDLFRGIRRINPAEM